MKLGAHKIMAVKRAFISFDFHHDEELRDTLIGQANQSDSPFNIEDWSVHERINRKWRKEVRSLIRKADLTIVICGEHTHDAKGVAAEVTITQEEKTPYFLLRAAQTRHAPSHRMYVERTRYTNGLGKT